MKESTLSVPFRILTLNSRGATPLYKQLYDELRRAILSGRLKAGIRLPATRELAEELRLSRNTVLGAYQQLLAEGYLEGVGGSGTFVARTLPEEMLHVRATSSQPTTQNSKSMPLSKRGQKLMEASPNLGDRVFGKPRPFRCATPDYSSFPFEIWTRLLAKHSRNPSPDLLGYTYPAGYGRLREVIAAYLRSARGVKCEAEQVIIVPGSQVAFDIASQMLLDSGDTVLIEDPGYFGARGVFARAGLHLAPVPVDAEGIDIKAIRENRDNARLVYVTPSFQFPLGVTMSLSRRLELLDWAQQSKAWIIEDDCDGEYRYTGRPIPSLQGLDGGQRVIYTGTFSKVLFPSLRIGYLVAPRDLVDSFVSGRVMTDLHSSTIPQAALADFIEEGHFARHLRRMRKQYAERQECFVTAAKTELSGLLEIEEREAGMHLIGWLPPSVDDQVAAEATKEHNLITLPLSAFSLKRLASGGLVLGYTAFNERQIRAGVRSLKVALSTNG
jgi:GntR family transcriptional regulator / MocR family aminotransferase